MVRSWVEQKLVSPDIPLRGDVRDPDVLSFKRYYLYHSEVPFLISSTSRVRKLKLEAWGSGADRGEIVLQHR